MKEINLGTVEKLVGEINHINYFNFGDEQRNGIKKHIIDMWEHFQIFYISNNSGHGEKHISEVLDRSFKITNSVIGKIGLESFYGFGFKSLHDIYSSLALATFVHDMFQEDHRADHQIRASKYVDLLIDRVTTNDIDIAKWLIYFDAEMLTTISLAVLEHRASYKGNFSNIFCEIFSASDRDYLDLDQIIIRSYSFNRKNINDQSIQRLDFPNKIIEINGNQYSTDKLIKDLLVNNWDNVSINVFYHIIDKFHRDGYAYKSINEYTVYKEFYKDQLEEFWKEIDIYILLPNLFYEKFMSSAK